MIKIGTNYNFETKSGQVFNFRSRSAISSIIFMINKLDLLWVPNFIALGIYIFLDQIFLEWRDWYILVLMSNMCYLVIILVLFGGYAVITAYSLVVTARCCLLLLVTARYRSLLLVAIFKMNDSSRVIMFYSVVTIGLLS